MKRMQKFYTKMPSSKKGTSKLDHRIPALPIEPQKGMGAIFEEVVQLVLRLLDEAERIS